MRKTERGEVGGGPPSLLTSRTREELWRGERQKLEIGEPFWGLSGLIMDEDVDGKGRGGTGWVSSLGAG